MHKPSPMFTPMFPPSMSPSRPGLYLAFLDAKRGFVMMAWSYDSWRDPVTTALEKNQALFWIGLAFESAAVNFKSFCWIMSGKDKAGEIAATVQCANRNWARRAATDEDNWARKVRALEDRLEHPTRVTDVSPLHNKIRELEAQIKAITPPPPRIGAAPGRYKAIFKWCPADSTSPKE